MARETGQPPPLPPPHKGCNSASCCSPAKLWRTLQSHIKSDDKKELVKFFKDERLQHIVRVALTSRLSNDASLYPPSQQHKVIKFTDRKLQLEALRYLGKPLTDLNSLQLALVTSSETMALTLLSLLKQHASAAEMKQFVNHVWGQGNTSLHLAVFLKRHAVIKALLDLGCTGILNSKRKNPIDCVFGDQQETSKLIDLLSSHDQRKPAHDSKRLQACSSAKTTIKTTTTKKQQAENKNVIAKVTVRKTEAKDTSQPNKAVTITKDASPSTIVNKIKAQVSSDNQNNKANVNAMNANTTNPAIKIPDILAADQYLFLMNYLKQYKQQKYLEKNSTRESYVRLLPPIQQMFLGQLKKPPDITSVIPSTIITCG